MKSLPARNRAGEYEIHRMRFRAAERSAAFFCGSKNGRKNKKYRLQINAFVYLVQRTLRIASSALSRRTALKRVIHTKKKQDFAKNGLIHGLIHVIHSFGEKNGIIFYGN